MGIKDLNKILKVKCQSALNVRPLSAFMGYRVAIDTSIFLYKFMYIYGNITDGLVRLTILLLKNGILPVYILDGKPPKEKSDVLKDRKERRDEMILVSKVLKDVREAKDHNPSIAKIDLEETIQESVKKNAKRDVENVNELFSSQELDLINRGSVEDLDKHCEAIEKKIIQIRREDIENVKELMRLFGVPCIIAQSEAESLCAVLCKRNIVDAVLSEDMDVLATGGKVLLKNLSMEKGGSVVEVCLEGVLSELEMNYDQFLDMCILCGCDYTSKIMGIGPIHAHKLMKKYGCIENGMTHMMEKFRVPDDFDYITSRALFKDACKDDDFEKYKMDVLQTPMMYKELVEFIQKKAPKMKGKPFVELEELSRDYKNEKAMYDKSEKHVSILKKIANPNLKSPKNVFNQATLENYFSKVAK